MSAGALIEKFGQEIKVFRDSNEEATLKGARVADTWKQFKIKASVQPMEPDETVEEDPGGECNKHGIRLYTSTELRVVIEGKFKADRVEYDGELFEVVKVEKWVRNKRFLTHYKAMAFRVNNEGIK